MEKRKSSALRRAVAVSVVATAVALPGVAVAAFSSSTSSSATFSTAAHFDDYREAVSASGAAHSYRLDEDPAGAVPSAMTDSAPAAAHGTLLSRTDGPLQSWSLDMARGRRASDESGSANSLRLRGAARLTGSGHLGTRGLELIADGAVRSSTVPFHTDQSFTASVWVRLDDPDDYYRTALASRGTHGSAFHLQYRVTTGKWAFVTSRSDAMEPVEDVASSTSTPVTGTWTLLTGVYDAVAGTNALYVDGVLQETVPHVAGWDAQLGVSAGELWFKAGVTDQWRGNLDDARVWQRALSGPEIADLHAGAPVSGTALALHWSFDEGAGTSAGDASGSGAAGTLHGGAHWDAGHAGTGLRMGAAYATAERNELNITKPFTVSSWVNTSTTTGWHTAISLPAANNWWDAFWLAQNDGKWCLQMSNGTTRWTSTTSVLSSASVSVGTWVHLTAVSTGTELVLYVDGVRQGNQAHTQTTASAGPVRIGQSVSADDRDQWVGSVDGIRNWQRALSPAEVADLAAGVGTPPAAEYLFDDGVGQQASDSSAHGRTSRITGGVAWAAGSATSPTGSHLDFPSDPAAYVASTEAPLSTDESFTVSAWVRLASNASDSVAISQPGLRTSPFSLGYDAALDQWEFRTTVSDADSVAEAAARGGSPSLATWTHLAGVFDRTTSTVTLLVDGAPVSSTSGVTTWRGSGGVRVGGALHDGLAAAPWAGALDDVRLWQRALPVSEVAAWASAALRPTSATAGLPGALQGVQQGLRATTAVALAGTGDAAHGPSSTAPGHFTIECWFRTGPGQGGTILAYDSQASGPSGTNDRALYVADDGSLRFQVSRAHGVRSQSTSLDDGAWHHVAVTVSPVEGTSLFVDGTFEAGAGPAGPATSYTGHWRVGSTNLAGYPSRPSSDRFVGTLDEIALYARALSAEEVSRHYYANH